MQAKTLSSDPEYDAWSLLLRKMTATESSVKRCSWGYKNYLISAPDSRDYLSLLAMQAEGLVHLLVQLRDGHDVFIATRKGCQFIELPRAVVDKVIDSVRVSNDI